MSKKLAEGVVQVTDVLHSILDNDSNIMFNYHQNQVPKVFNIKTIENELNNKDLILYNFKITGKFKTRILTVGILKSKLNLGDYVDESFIKDLKQPYYYITLNTIHLTMSYSITDGNNDKKIADKIIRGRLLKYKNGYNNFVNINPNLYSKMLEAHISLNFARFITNTILSKVKDVKGKEINIEVLQNE